MSKEIMPHGFDAIKSPEHPPEVEAMRSAAGFAKLIESAVGIEGESVENGTYRAAYAVDPEDRLGLSGSLPLNPQIKNLELIYSKEEGEHHYAMTLNQYSNFGGFVREHGDAVSVMVSILEDSGSMSVGIQRSLDVDDVDLSGYVAADTLSIFRESAEMIMNQQAE